MADPTKTTEIPPTTTPSDVTPPADGGKPSGLPSDKASAVTLNFELTDTVKEKYVTTDGKLLGKYDNLEQLAEAHKHLQDKHAQYVDDVKKQTSEITSEVETDVQNAKKMETIKTLIPKFLEANLELTPEIEEALTQDGLDIRDIKLGAIELRDKIRSAHETVGGKENYESMMAWASTALSDTEKSAFDQDVMSVNSRFAIKGLYNEFQEANKDGEQPESGRIVGNSTVKGVRPYESQTEILVDKRYLNTAAGKRDAAAKAKYTARLAITPEEVWKGR